MKRWTPLVLLLAIGLTFLILNRGAYKGYFRDDELEAILVTRDLKAPEWIYWFVTPRLSEANFRPVGYIYYFEMNRLVGLNFPRWVIPVHVLHLISIVLLWLLLCRLKINPYAAVAGAAFFALNVSAFDIFWKPMFIVDLLCGMFCLLALLLYASGRWIAAIPAMWLAYKSKELAVMLPMALLAYEIWFGNRNWKRLIPFFAISLCFGIQAVLSPQPKGSPYAFVITPLAFWQTLQFYSSRLFLLPYVGITLLILPFVIRDRRIWWGAAIICAFFAPLMFLPQRVFGAYTYVPLTGAAIELAVIASLVPPVAVLAFFAAWVPWNIHQLRIDRKASLTADDQVRIYAGALMDFTRQHPNPPVIALLSRPDSFQMWGVRAALNFPNLNPHEPLQIIDGNQARTLPRSTPVTFIDWDQDHNKVRLLSKDPSNPDASYLKMGQETPFWQLDSGWYALDDYFRWTGPQATAQLFWPAEATQFEVVVNVSPTLIRMNGYTEVRLTINGQDLGSRRFDRPGIEASRWNIPAKYTSDAMIELNITPASHFPPDPRLLGAPVVSFGFVKSKDGH